MNAGIVNETAVSQMEATYYSICTSILDLKEQINQVENSLVLLLAVHLIPYKEVIGKPATAETFLSRHTRLFIIKPP